MSKYKKLAFTFVEVMIVMALISFLYVMTTKVIQHNLDAKASSYVYNLYKNLESENVFVTKKLLNQANNNGPSGDGSNDGNNNEGADDNTGNGEDSNNGNGNGGTGSENNTSNKSIDEVLKQTDAKSYCNAFSKDLNLIGNADCENSSRDQNAVTSQTKEINYNCSRTYNFVVNDDGTYSEIMSPKLEEASTTCEENSDFSLDNIICKASPKVSIEGLLIDNTKNMYAYSCTKINDGENDEPLEESENLSENENAFDIDMKPQNFGNSLKTTNNIHLNFVTFTSPNDKYKPIYNFTTKLNQEAICPLPPENYTVPLCNFKNDEYCWDDPGPMILKEIRNSVSTYYDKSTNQCRTSGKIVYKMSTDCIIGSRGYNFSQKKDMSFSLATSQLPQIGTTCQNYIDYAYENFNNPKGDTVSKTIDAGNITMKNKCVTHTWDSLKRGPMLWYQFNNNQVNYLSNYYTKWNNFFTKNPDIPKETKAAIDIEGQNEGVIENLEAYEIENENKENSYLAHFIYASIDTPFSEAQIGKNLFVFEQFKDKIIPVGYLANNANTPLKFNVITRDPQTMKIKTLNSKPLTYCEAMKYTGQDFSQYCNCKDESGKVVTKYDIDASCNNNFGCMIKAVRTTATPSKFRLF